MALTDDDIREILRIIDESKLDELRVETEGFTLHVRKDGSGLSVASRDSLTESAAAAPGVTTAQPAGGTIDAPMLGTFYRAPAPGEAPFVDVGDEVEPGTVVGLIEVMKMMNSIEARVSGTIEAVCAENAEIVEAGAPLFRIR
jgi:acetyl-CoA carboxylase biotin carboxyl carrier protein